MAFELSMTRGDSRTLRVMATWPEDVPEAGATEGDPFPLSGKLLIFTAKTSTRLPDDDATFQKRSDGASPGIVVGSPTNTAAIEIETADTDSLEQAKTLVCDLQVIDGTDIWTVASGTLRVNVDVTRATA